MATVLVQKGHTNPEIWDKMLNPEQEQEQEVIRFLENPEDLDLFLKRLEEENAWSNVGSTSADAPRVAS